MHAEASTVKVNNLREVQNVGDYYEITYDANGKGFFDAEMPSVEHDIVVSGVYECIIEASGGSKTTIDLNFLNGGVITTQGTPSDGVGIKGLLQLAGRTNVSGGTGQNGVSGYFGGNGGHAGSPYIGGPGCDGGPGYFGGNGSGGYPHCTSPKAGGRGGDGYVPGIGANSSYCSECKTYHNLVKAANGTAMPLTSTTPINQKSDGSVKYRAFGKLMQKDIAISAHSSLVARIRITLKEVKPDMLPEDSDISVVVDDTLLFKEILNMKGILLNSLSGSSGTTEPQDTENREVLVLANKPFSVRLLGYDTIDSFSSNGISFINDIPGDNFIELTGQINGEQSVILNTSQGSIMIKSILEPNSATVQQLL